MKTFHDDFLSRLKALGHEAYNRLPAIIEAADSVVSLRVNPARWRRACAPFPDAEPVEWHPGGFYLADRPSFTYDPRLHQGVYYVQDASSMAVGAVVGKAVSMCDNARPLRYLDACAAPGGKTTTAVDALPPDAFVVANEFDSRRVKVLVENLAKWGGESYITNADASAMSLPADFFDIIAADVPCSGEGMMRKDPYAIEQWTPGLVRQCATVQRSIVDNLWKALKPGGFMIYSTCTFNLSENEEIIDYMVKCLGGEPIDVPLRYEGILGAMGGYDFPAYRFVPGEVRGEGLFLAMVRKPESSGADSAVRKHTSGRRSVSAKPGFIKDLSEQLEGNYTTVSDKPLRLIREEHLACYETMMRHTPALMAGVEPGEFKGRDFIPSQSLALARSFNNTGFPSVEIDDDTAIRYLRREAICLDGAPRGIVLLTRENLPVGWVKNLGSRANNLYPDSWRIRN